MKMFATDKPIENDTEDILGRDKFIDHLVDSIQLWDGKESIAVALYGAWGDGKTSILNLTEKKLKEIRSRDFRYIKFCPWMLSESDNLIESFINEMNRAIGKKGLLRKYAKLLSNIPNKEDAKTIWNGILFIATLLGATTTGVLQLISNASAFLKWGAPIFTLGCLIANKFLPLLFKSQSVIDTKNQIAKKLKGNKKKLLVIIDDLDRLSTQEIRQVFRIIRTNADFPNTMYLLAFDREVVEKSLGVQEGISGPKYLEKMIQASFTLPSIPHSTILKYLTDELNKIIELYPSMKISFEDRYYSQQIYDAGFKNFFTNLRDVKRFMNSLTFNLPQLILDDSLEVNPIDFMAIEALRLFETKFYNFLMNNKSLFTDSVSPDSSIEEERTAQRLEIYKLISKKNKSSVMSLLSVLFPQVIGINFDIKDSIANYRICLPSKFDAYFNFIPGAGNGEINMFDIKKFSTATNNYDSLVNIINDYKSQGRYLLLINTLQYFVEDTDYFQTACYPIIILALLDSFVDLEIVRSFVPFSSIDYQIVMLIHALLSRNKDDLKLNYIILETVVKEAKSLCGLVFYLSVDIDQFEKSETHTWERILVDSDINTIKALCAKKILENKEKILDEKMAPLILSHWKKWGDGADYKDFLDGLSKNDSDFLKFLDQFVFNSSGISFDYKNPGIIMLTQFSYNSLKEFFDLDEVKQRLEKIKANTELYNQHKPVIDFYLNNFEHRNSLM
jgi:Cdc6-like AAA superfamily ATPase